MLSVHAFVISWPGQESNATHIAAQIQNVGGQVTVIHSTKDNVILQPSTNWVQVPDEWYYGPKCARALEMNRSDIHLQIHADATCNDWPGLIRRCRSVYSQIPNLGVWAPSVDYTYWQSWFVEVSRLDDQRLLCVAQTDCIVWSFAHSVASRLKALDYRDNNLGWGIDWAAIAYSVSHGLLVLRDESVAVNHPYGTGYETEIAGQQMRGFLEQLTNEEKVAYTLLERFVQSRQLGL